MKTITAFFKRHLPRVSALCIFFFTSVAFAVAQGKGNSPVKVKIVKIVDGDTITVEKTMDETRKERHVYCVNKTRQNNYKQENHH